jgi:hypothetical protein
VMDAAATPFAIKQGIKRILRRRAFAGMTRLQGRSGATNPLRADVRGEKDESPARSGETCKGPRGGGLAYKVIEYTTLPLPCAKNRNLILLLIGRKLPTLY